MSSLSEDLYKKILEANTKLHEIEAPYYERLHPEEFNWFEQARITRDLKLIKKHLPGLPLALDIGCGTGNIALKLLGMGFEVSGVDMSEDMLAVLKKRIPKLFQYRIRLFCEDIERFLDGSAGSFDLITISSVLHHLPEYARTLERAIGLLRPGGYIYIAHEPTKGALAPDRFLRKILWQVDNLVYLALSFGRRPRTEKRDYRISDYHLYHGFDEEAVASACRKAGLDVVRFEKYASAMRLGISCWIDSVLLKSKPQFCLMAVKPAKEARLRRHRGAMQKITVFLKAGIDIFRTFFYLKIYKRIDRIESTIAYSDLQFLFLAARDGWGDGNIVEIGSYKGKSMAALALGTKFAKREKAVSIDTHSGGTEQIFLKNMDRIGASDYMVPMTMASKDAAGTFNSGIRLIFIDGAHDYESVKSDILCWKDKLIDGGIIAFHDYYFPSVSRAIDELIRSPGKFTIEGTVGCTLFASKGTRKNAELFEKIIIFNSIKNAIRRIFKEKEMDGSPMLINEYRGIAPRIKLLIKKRLPGVYERHIKRISVAIIDRRRAGAIMASIKKIISVDPFPIFKLVEIETINRCNNTCQFCPVNRNDDPRPFRLMDESLFRSIIGQLRELNYSGCINLSANNEPLMDGRICELAGIARQALPSAYIHMVTNGMALTIDKLKNLMKHMDMLTIDNYDDDLKLIKPIRDVYDYCRFNNVYQDKIKIYLRLKTDILSNRAGQAKNRSKVKPLQSSCGYPFLQFVIRPDGKVSLCCNDALGQMTMGDLTKESISSVWNGAIFRETRERLLEGRKSVKLCSGCDGNI